MLDQLSADRSLDRFRGEYQKLLRAVRKSHGAGLALSCARLYTDVTIYQRQKLSSDP